MSTPALNANNTSSHSNSNSNNNNNDGFSELGKVIEDQYVWGFICVVMILSNLFLIFLIYWYRKCRTNPNIIIGNPNKMQYESIYYLVYFIVLYFVPCGGMILFYGRIYCLAHHHAKLLTTYDQCKQWIQNVRAAKTLSILVGIYIACWTPFVTIFLVVRYKVPPNWTLEEIMKVIKILRYIAFSNPAINAFLYGYFNQVLRQHTVQTIKNQLCCETKYSSNNQYPNSGSFPTIPKTLNNNKIRNCKLGYNVDTKLFQKDHTYPEQFYFKSTRF
ncbi:uncharacterized protein TRIADDRAFT_54041 [Trichoplax adhaerens]|uniref:G-protein coupled receptors family 1 profile domain-containing protein n=1 Tax=Trichoplax adhaerens TaxID=10228 RepID=B3RQY2_TRIAD|nr:hypothetical protein TRIADDRAFT_54041 [Trichoplax adhaerens]EDV26782.1 hypothetical protein TRIADDRAFT_54041 [Trichoplax adhaerens]|eukprot:XP_002110778.1 hypothetical protein TRIADDRAFT_54041 [Trichoplax adhaerens]